MQKIDLSTWSRKPQFEFFSGFSDPFYTLTVPLDVDNLYKFKKEKGISFYYALCFLVVKALESVDAFRVKIIDGIPYMTDKLVPSFTDLSNVSGEFHITTLDAGDDLIDFCRRAAKTSGEQTCFMLSHDFAPESLVYFTCLPWCDITTVTNEKDPNTDDSVPRIAWGKYYDEGGRKKLHMALELNHRLVDGRHIGLFYEQLEKSIRNPEIFCK